MHVRHWLRAAGLLGTICVAGCATTTVDFDRLPGGGAVMGQSTPVLEGGAVSAQSLINSQYASEGLTFASGSPAVFAASFAPNVPSAPNVACPTQANGTAGFSTPTEIRVTSDHICNVWATITASSGPATMKAFDASGNQIGPAVSSHGSSPGSAGAAETLHINACDIRRVELSGTNYCFDDVKIRR